ncbi:hypothetical protein ALP02_200083 [Pseudomonas coronafaciens pv. garcae]|nr:hypothetical protein ALP02_200083 [Pseudomonas coronafaciens pv. garcae]
MRTPYYKDLSMTVSFLREVAWDYPHLAGIFCSRKHHQPHL